MKRSYSHIMNFISREENPGFFPVQENTLRSLESLKKHSGKDVEFIAACFPGAEGQIPSVFSKCVLLKRDVTQLHRFSVQRRLPLLSDILSECADSRSEETRLNSSHRT